MITKNLGPGTFPSIVFHNDEWWVARQRQGGISFGTLEKPTIQKLDGPYSRPVLWSDGLTLWWAYRAGVGVDKQVAIVSTVGAVGLTTGGRTPLMGVGWVVWVEPGTGTGGKRILGLPRVGLGNPPTFLRMTRASNGLGRIVGLDSDSQLPTVLDYDENRKEVPGVFSPQFAGDWMVAEHQTAGTAVRHLPSGKKRVLWPDWVRLTPQCAVAPDGTLGVVSYGGGKGVEVALVTLADMEQPKPDPRPVPYFAPLNRPIDVGYFKAWGDRYGDWPEAPGNCVVCDEEPEGATRALSAGRRVWLGNGTSHIPARSNPNVVGIYIGEEESLDSLEDNVKAYRTDPEFAGKPIITYTARQGWIVEGNDIIHGVEGYLLREEGTPQETADMLRVQLGQSLSRYKPEHRLALIAQAYDRNGTWGNAGPHLAAMQPVYYEVAQADQRVEAILWFSA